MCDNNYEVIHMSTQAELIKDCMNRIIRLRYAESAEPQSVEIKKLIAEEEKLLEEIKKAN
jgi:hypothetical protein